MCGYSCPLQANIELRINLKNWKLRDGSTESSSFIFAPQNHLRPVATQRGVNWIVINCNAYRSSICLFILLMGHASACQLLETSHYRGRGKKPWARESHAMLLLSARKGNQSFLSLRQIGHLMPSCELRCVLTLHRAGGPFRVGCGHRASQQFVPNHKM